MTTHTTHKHAHRSHHSNYNLSNDVEKIKAAVFGAAENAKDKANEVIVNSIDDVKKQTNKFKNSVSLYTTEKPLQTLGIALLAGVVIGYLLHK